VGPGGKRLAEALRENRVAVTAAAVLVVLIAGAARWVAHSRAEPPQKRVLSITGVIIKPEPPPQRQPPPPPQPPKVEEPQTRLVEVKGSDIPPPDAAPPPAAGPLALASEATGEGDAFHLAGNPGGRSLVGSGAGGDGTGVGGGGVDAAARYGWYFSRIAQAIEEAFRRMPRTRTAEARVEFKVWADAEGRITRVQLVRTSGYQEVDEAIRSVVGLKLREPLPPDLPMPVLYRYTARRPG